MPILLCKCDYLAKKDFLSQLNKLYGVAWLLIQALARQDM